MAKNKVERATRLALYTQMRNKILDIEAAQGFQGLCHILYSVLLKRGEKGDIIHLENLPELVYLREDYHGIYWWESYPVTAAMEKRRKILTKAIDLLVNIRAQEEKLKMLKDLLRGINIDLILHRGYDRGLCHRIVGSPYLTIISIPELYATRPLVNENGSWWYSLDRRGLKKRGTAVRAAIKKVESTIF